MSLTIAPLYAAVLALFFVFLSFTVIRGRASEKVSLGDGGSPLVERRMRAHANFAEYVPFTLLLIAFFELRGDGIELRVHVLCLLLVAGRLAHAYGVGSAAQRMPFRMAGMIMTFAALIGSALANLSLLL